MDKFETLDSLLEKNNGYLKTSDALLTGISKSYLSEYVRVRELERVAHGLYMSPDAWEDGLYVIQARYPRAVFSHETALYLLGLAEREPLKYSVTMKAGTNGSGLTRQGIKVYKVKEELFDVGTMDAVSPASHSLRVYNAERTVCDLVRSRSNIEAQDLQSALKMYISSRNKNIPLLMRYAKSFSVGKIIRQYLEVLL